MGPDRWRRRFEESGLYPRVSAQDEDQAGQKHIPVNLYSTTRKSLNKHSAAYVEYAAGEGFYECRETFLLCHPDERKRWESEEWPQGRPLQRDSDPRADISSYSLTSLQMHFGFPLYSIHEIEDWRVAYLTMLQTTDRPLHKVALRMKDPFITISGTPRITPRGLDDIFTWALTISRKHFPVFMMHESLPILDMLDYEQVRRFYFIVSNPLFVSLEEFKVLIENEPALADHVETQIKLLYNRSKREHPEENFLQPKDRRDTADRLVSLLAAFASEDPPANGSFEFQPTAHGPSVHLKREPAGSPRLRALIETHFMTPCATPQLRTGLTEEMVRTRIHESPAFQRCFLEKCEEAAEYWLARGESPDELPMLLRDH